MIAPLKSGVLVDRLSGIVGNENVVVDSAHLSTLSHDISDAAAVLPICAVRPETRDQAQAAMREIAIDGAGVVPRGGGFSYTGGYGPSEAGCVLVDLTALSRIIEVNVDDRYAIVEAGCTWAALDSALDGSGYRPPFFGPLSGSESTIGGAVSQNASFFGSAGHGGVAASLIGLEVLLADGNLLRTGVLREDGVDAQPHGPDLTSLFVGDCGALGVKLQVAVRLLPIPMGEAFLSVGFEDGRSMVEAQCRLAGTPGLGECFAFDATAHRNILDRRVGFREKIGTLASVAKQVDGLGKAARMPIDRLGFLENLPFSLHVSVEGDSRDHAAARAKTIEASVVGAGGRVLPDTIPRVTRARRFGAITTLLGAGGENWLPVHGAVPLSQAPGCYAVFGDLLARRANDMISAGVTATVLTVLTGRAILIEPQFFWPDALNAFHRAYATDEQIAQYRDRQANPEGRKIVQSLKSVVLEILSEFGASQMQLGRAYSYEARLEPAQLKAIRGIRAILDPHGRMNPGVLGAGTDLKTAFTQGE